MPLYDFACENCGERFEERTGETDRPPCPRCGAARATRVPAAFAGPFTTRPYGLAAKRSQAARSAREEQRREQREQRRSRTEYG
ncbi:MAG: FmdB family zinc ribbon protein [Solirubrobacteraceae bacterium]